MAKPRTPTNVLKLKGSDKVHPERMAKRAHEPEPNGEIGDPPECMSEDARKCWVEIVSLCHAGVLCAADRLMMEHGARALAALRAADDYADKTLYPLMVRLETVLAKFGMSPADRSRVSRLKPSEEKNPYAEFG